MRSFASLRVLGFLVLTICGCKKDPPEDALYGSLDPPDPNKLQGVYQLIVSDGGQTTEIRLDFEKDTLSGGVKCTPKNPAYAQITVGGSVALDTGVLEAASGKFTIESFQMEKLEDPIDCQGGLRGGTYSFKVEDLKLTLTLDGVPEPIIYGKLGQNG
jgi:hypothetical protein